MSTPNKVHYVVSVHNGYEWIVRYRGVKEERALSTKRFFLTKTNHVRAVCVAPDGSFIKKI